MLQQSFLEFIQAGHFPCIGAKAAAKKDVIHFVMSSSLSDNHDDIKILSELYRFIENWKSHQEVLQSLVIIFSDDNHYTEQQFETLLWQKLQHIHQLDSEVYVWDPAVSHDVDDSHFCFSIGEHSFFIVGMHPNSSRVARQFIRPALVFNLHEQFETIRDEGHFEKMRDKIREQDLKFNGSINPMVEDFGKHTEALQYSGREVSINHRCPFHFVENIENWNIIEAKSAEAFVLKKNELLIVRDIFGQQVADLFCFNLHDHSEFLSSGRSIDYASKIYLTTNDSLYSNKSKPLLTIVKDDVGRHDFLFTPCNHDTFQIIYDMPEDCRGCEENLIQVFEPYGIDPNYITTTFNIFMHSDMSEKGELRVLPPLSKKNDNIIFKSHQDLIVGLTACSAGQSNNFAYKPIAYKILV